MRPLLRSGLAGVALLAGVTGSLAQDRTNVAPFTNSGAYAGNVLSNTSTITNNAPGYWTGAIQSNAGTISNNLGATWDGSVRNTGLVRNYGIWIGDVLSNSIGDIRNSGVGAVWTGDVTSNSQIVNENGATWRGKVLGNTNVIFNHANSSWIGDVVANGPIGQIDQFGL